MPRSSSGCIGSQATGWPPVPVPACGTRCIPHAIVKMKSLPVEWKLIFPQRGTIPHSSAPRFPHFPHPGTEHFGASSLLPKAYILTRPAPAEVLRFGPPCPLTRAYILAVPPLPLPSNRELFAPALGAINTRTADRPAYLVNKWARSIPRSPCALYSRWYTQPCEHSRAISNGGGKDGT